MQGLLVDTLRGGLPDHALLPASAGGFGGEDGASAGLRLGLSCGLVQPALVGRLGA